LKLSLIFIRAGFSIRYFKAIYKELLCITIDRDLVNEVFYPSGFIDFVVKISGGSAATTINGRYKDTPEVELLGHLTLPTRLRVAKGTSY